MREVKKIIIKNSFKAIKTFEVNLHLILKQNLSLQLILRVQKRCFSWKQTIIQ
jgi:hypothetical protein